ncbi:MAG: protein kinase, partial [Thermoguttaceae bacterium]|nr:protein kinase [Thermoguttaceae bacterium]
ILLLDDGVVKITDFGIAQYFGSSRLTGVNQVVGTIEYMAPEQAKAGPLTPRADLYSLGALLYALLTGEPPYRARSLPELLRRYNEETPESIRRARPEAPNVLDVFLRELLQISPEKRPGDARLAGRRLEGLLKTASGLENGNPFLNCRFCLDGRSFEAETADGGEARVDALESSSDSAFNLPYRALSDEQAEENVASPFERTTEVNEEERKSIGLTSTLSCGAPENSDFELATDANDGDGVASADARGNDGAAVAFGSGNGETETDFRAPTAVGTESWTIEREGETSPSTEDAWEGGDDSTGVEASTLDKYKKSRFVPVDEGELDALPPRNERRFFWWAAQIFLTFVVLGGLVVFLWRAFQAPTADRLFERIESELSVSDDEISGALRRAEKDLRQMVELYPSDPRSEIAGEWLERLEAESAENRLERRLERKRRGVPASAIERAYLAALRVAEENPDEGLVKLTAFVELFAGAEAQAKTRRSSGKTNEVAEDEAGLTQALVAVATRKLERLREEREKTRAEDLALIAERWRAAVATSATNRAEGERLRLALLELYGERAWADDALREAKATD